MSAAQRPVDPSGCDTEPIHVPGAIQPHGVLLALREPGLELLQASDNLGALLGLPAPRPGAPLDGVLGAAIADAVRAELPPADLGGRPQLLGRHTVAGRDCDVIVHRHAGVLFVELEVEPGDGGTDFRAIYGVVRSFVARLREADATDTMCRLAAAEVRRMTCFGHVMVYAFDAEGHGQVLAEDRDAAYPSYDDHRFPASDIPRQARELYRRNHLRLIADAGYRPARLEPPLHPDTGAPTDLSYAVLRSVSPVHLEYMRNMGTWASMSCSLIVGDQLWGLISCLDAAPRRVPYGLRAAFEHVGQVLALQIEGHEERREIDHRLQLRTTLVALLAAMGRTDGALEHLVEIDRGEPLLRMGAATGAAVVVGNQCATVGRVPERPLIDALVAWLADAGGDVHATDRLGERFAPARPHAALASGLLAVAVSKLHRNYVLWFRPEVVQTVRWAGDPALAKQAGIDGRLHPRASFATWQEVVQGRSLPWRSSELDMAVEFRNAMLGIVLRKAEEVAALAGELARSNAELEAFSYSVSHDLRAPLRHIAGYADLVEDGDRRVLSERGLRFIRHIREAAGFAGALVDALLSFSRIGRTGIKPVRVELDALIASVVRAPAFCKQAEVAWDIGPLPTVHGDPVLLKVAVENLVGNALKYSATRTPARIRVAAVETAEQHGFEIEDNGVGFDMQYAHKLFGVFQRLHSMDDFEGTGIGLANVRRIAERHGGSVGASGAVGRGAAFTFLLPKIPPTV